MSFEDIPEPRPQSTIVEYKGWSTSKIIKFCLLTGFAAGLDAIAGSPIMGSPWRDFFVLGNNTILAALRFWFTSQPIG